MVDAIKVIRVPADRRRDEPWASPNPRLASESTTESISPSQVRDLQQTAGNRAVTALISGGHRRLVQRAKADGRISINRGTPPCRGRGRRPGRDRRRQPFRPRERRRRGRDVRRRHDGLPSLRPVVREHLYPLLQSYTATGGAWRRCASPSRGRGRDRRVRRRSGPRDPGRSDVRQDGRDRPQHALHARGPRRDRATRAGDRRVRACPDATIEDYLLTYGPPGPPPTRSASASSGPRWTPRRTNFSRCNTEEAGKSYADWAKVKLPAGQALADRSLGRLYAARRAHGGRTARRRRLAARTAGRASACGWRSGSWKTAKIPEFPLRVKSFY